MGIQIYGELIPDRIPKDAWGKIYDESLAILRQGKLAEGKTFELGGVTCWGVIPSEDENGCWHVTGDLITGLNMEDHVLRREPDWWGRSADNGGDILLRRVDPEKYGLACPEVEGFFGAKTQGARGHLPLLAVACLIADTFPNAVMLSGDITAAQCFRAAEIVKAALGKEIRLPLQFDEERLLERVRRLFPSDGVKAFQLFTELYEGFRDPEYKRFISESFPLESIYAYFQTAYTEKPLEPIVRDWLELGLPLRELCALTTELGHTAKELTEVLVHGRVHVSDKSTYDVTKTAPENDRPDDVRRLFVRLYAKMAGFCNRNIDAYFPLDEIRHTLREAYPTEPVDELLDAALAAEESVPDETDGKGKHTKLVDDVYAGVSLAAGQQARQESYDIKEFSDLYFWDSPEDTVHPELEEKVFSLVRQVLTFGGDQWEKVKRMDGVSRMAYLAELYNYNIPMKKTTWEMLWEHITDDSILRRYVALSCVDRGNDFGRSFVNVMGMNEKLFAYLCDHTEREM